ncbi:MAG: MFS transporter [Spirochaetia bacterium]|nr:MFS transporter [Spirochaetia bacterium]
MKTTGKIPLSVQVIYGLGVSYAIFDQIFAQWVLTYYLPPQKFSFHAFMSPLFIALALIISRFVDMVSDPLVGWWSDRTDTRWGRRMPFIALGAVPLALSTVGFFFPPKSGGLGSFTYLAIIGSLFFIFYTIVGAPYNALIPELSSSREDRLNLSTWQAVFRLVYSAVAMILPGILIATLGKGDDEKGLRLMVIILSAFALIGLFLLSFGVDEKKYSGGQQSAQSLGGSLRIIFGEKPFIWYLGGLTFFFIGFNILRATMNYFVVDIMGKSPAMITPVSALFFGTAAFFFYPVKKISYRFGFKIPMLISLFMLFILSRALGMLGKTLPVNAGYAVFTLCGIPVAGAAFIFPQAMLSEISAYVSSKSKEKIGGIFFGIQGFFLKLAFLISIAVLPAILVWDGSIPFLEMMVSVPKQPEAVGIYRSAFTAGICFAISFVCYWCYKEKKADD